MAEAVQPVASPPAVAPPPPAAPPAPPAAAPTTPPQPPAATAPANPPTGGQPSNAAPSGADAGNQNTPAASAPAVAPNGTPPAATPGLLDAKPTEAADVLKGLKLPEGVLADAVARNDFNTLMRELGEKLPKGEIKLEDAAQKLVDFSVSIQKREAQVQQEAFAKTVKDWEAAAAVDKEYGGQAFQENLQKGLRALERFASPEFRQFLSQTRLSSHPEMVRFVYRIGKNMSEDTIRGAAGEGGGVVTPPEPVSEYDQMYRDNTGKRNASPQAKE